MTDEQWIEIPGWDKFQHYKDRHARWIKNYTELLSRPEYLELTFHQRGVLHGIWLEYARSARQLRGITATDPRRPSGSPATLTRQLGQRVATRDLEALNHAGFIHLTASKPLASRAPARSQEGERERDPPQPPLPEGGQKSLRDNGTNPRAKAAADRKLESLTAWIRRVKDEYSRPAILEELTKAYHLDPTTAATLLDQTLIQHPTAGHAGDADVPF